MGCQAIVGCAAHAAATSRLGNAPTAEPVRKYPPSAARGRRLGRTASSPPGCRPTARPRRGAGCHRPARRVCPSPPARRRTRDSRGWYESPRPGRRRPTRTTRRRDRHRQRRPGTQAREARRSPSPGPRPSDPPRGRPGRRGGARPSSLASKIALETIVDGSLSATSPRETNQCCASRVMSSPSAAFTYARRRRAIYAPASQSTSRISTFQSSCSRERPSSSADAVRLRKPSAKSAITLLIEHQPYRARAKS